jgi:glycosyltransferase involved in cell wall biosynthesis
MKILHVIDSGGFYGAEVMLVNLVEEQVRQGLQPVIASIGEPWIEEKPLEVEAKKRGLPVKIFRMRPGLNIRGVRQLLRYCHEEKFDLIHSHGYKCNILLGPLPRFIRKKPLLSTLHGWTSTTGITKMRIYEWLDAMSLRFLDGVILVNKKMLRHPKLARLKKEKLFVVDNGISVTPYGSTMLGPLDPNIVEFCRDGFVIGSIGRYSVEKGFDILLKAFRLVLDEVSNAKLLLLGEGDQRPQFESIIAENNLTDNVMLTGYRQDAWRYLSLMKVYVISSLTEGLPITLLEAMRSKVPVVATRVGGIPDVLKDGAGGLLVDPGNSNKLAEAITSIWFEPDICKKRVEYSCTRFEQRYSSRIMSENYSKIYKEITDEM